MDHVSEEGVATAVDDRRVWAGVMVYTGVTSD